MQVGLPDLFCFAIKKDVALVIKCGRRMTTCLGKSCLFDLPCMYIVNVYQFVSVLFSLLVLRVGHGS